VSVINKSNQDNILQFILSQNGETTEFDILQHLSKQWPDFFAVINLKPSLFQQHFYLFNQLYQIDDQLKSSNQSLLISALKIQLIAYQQADQGDECLIEQDPLRAFYLDFDNINLSEQEIASMMDKFWQKYLAIDKKAESLVILGLQNENNLTRSKIKQRYSQLSQSAHPDKGGSDSAFIKIKQAADTLLELF